MSTNYLVCNSQYKHYTNAILNAKLKTISLAGLAISALALSGCSSVMNTADNDTFSCPGMPAGVTCKTPAAVYKSSNGDIAPTEFDAPYGNYADTGSKIKSSALTVQGGYQVSGTPSVPMPVREPAKIMRIWVSPWIDKNDNWNSGSYQFAEIVQRKWSFGKSEATGGGVVVPYRDAASAILPAMTDAFKTSAPAQNIVSKATQPFNKNSLPTMPNTGDFNLGAGMPPATTY